MSHGIRIKIACYVSITRICVCIPLLLKYVHVQAYKYHDSMNLMFDVNMFMNRFNCLSLLLRLRNSEITYVRKSLLFLGGSARASAADASTPRRPCSHLTSTRMVFSTCCWHLLLALAVGTCCGHLLMTLTFDTSREVREH